MKRLNRIWVLLFSIIIFLTVAVAGIKGNDNDSSSVKIAFVGDILLAGGAGQMMTKYGLSYPFEKVVNILESADIVFGNLECSLTGNTITKNVPLVDKTGKKTKSFVFKVPPKYAESLRLAGFDIVSLANNHTLNGGRKGLQETIETLEKLGIQYVGAGKDYSESRSCRVIGKKDKKIGFLAYSDIGPIPATNNEPGVASAKDIPLILKEIQQAKNLVDILIVSLHWGIERETRPSQRQRELAWKMIGAGADIIIGHHPHVLQPIEIYQGKTIAYSLGNFVFDNPKLSQRKTMVLFVKIDERGNQRFYQIPCEIRNFRPIPLNRDF